MILVWFYRFIKIYRLKEGELKPQKLIIIPLNSYTNYIWTETFWKAYLLSYFFVYNCLKKKFKKEKLDSDLFFIIFFNFLIRQLTGFPKKLIIDSFNISLKLRVWRNYISFYNDWFLQILPIVSKDYLIIEEKRIYFKNNELEFNPSKDNIFFKNNINRDIELFINKNKKELKNLDIILNKLKRFTLIENVNIKNINSPHICFISKYFNNNEVLVSTLTTNKNLKNDILYKFKNEKTKITSYIMSPIIINSYDIEPIELKINSEFSTRKIINTENQINLYLISLFLNNKYQITNKIEFNKNVYNIIKELNILYNDKILYLTNYEKKLCWLSYIKLYNFDIYNNLTIVFNKEYDNNIILYTYW